MDERAVEQSARKKAFLNFVLRAVDAMHPDYLAIGVESNMLLSRNQAKWQQLEGTAARHLHGSKKSTVCCRFFTTEVLHYKGLTRDSKGTDQEKEVADMMRSSDLFAMSLYPHMSAEMPRVIPAKLSRIRKAIQKGIAVAESGMTSRNVGDQVVRDDALRFRSGPGAVR